MVELLKNRSILSLVGEDSLTFLQNIVTNDLGSKIYSYNYLLSPQGRYLFDFFVFKFQFDRLLIDVDSFSSELLFRTLDLYKLRKDVEINNVSSKYSILYSKEKLDITDEVIFSHQDPRFFRLGFRSLVKSSYIKENLKADEQTSDEIARSMNLYIKDKYEHAIPDGIDDLIFDNSLVSQYGAEELSAISFSKGCYVGQEVISRAKYQGSVRKKLFKLSCDTELTSNELGTKVTDLAGGAIGIFCSGYNNLGMALLNEEKYFGLSMKSGIVGGTKEVAIVQPEWR